MSIPVNRNTIWCNIFANVLQQNSIKNTCISPGSRSTPLTYSIAANKYFKKYILTDERNSGFFALGLAKSTNSPVVVVTTSGTAVAELYPSIIEAFYQHVPLLICTADRPFYLRNTGANQTINQENIFKNHICHFYEANLPDLQMKNLLKYQVNLQKALKIALEQKGPVHINFQFEKPFEPESYTDKVSSKTIKKVFQLTNSIENSANEKAVLKKNTLKLIEQAKSGLIFCGFGNYSKDFFYDCVKLSEHLNFPIVADGASGLRFGPHINENIVENFNSLLKSKKFLKNFNPQLIIQFGGAPTSNAMLDFFENMSAEKIIVNEFGDKNDPSLTAKYILKVNPTDFISEIFSKIKKKNNNQWITKIKSLNQIVDVHKTNFLSAAKEFFEGKVITELIDALPNKCNLMVSNSLPIRDVDFFAQKTKKKINLFVNRGASGIDGIISTALGIKANDKKLPTYLLIGDLAFMHDFNSLFNSIKFSLPITIILINNNGGGIFESLPISNYGKIFKEYFLTPHNISFADPIKSLGGNYHFIKNWNDFKKQILNSSKSRIFSVLEFKTNARKSKLIRDKYWKAVKDEIDKLIDEN